jgi:hypothetical protein
MRRVVKSCVRCITETSLLSALWSLLFRHWFSIEKSPLHVLYNCVCKRRLA